MALDSDDWLIFGAAIAGLYLLAQMSRSQSAAAAESTGVLSFPSAAPTTGADIVGSVVPMSVSAYGVAAIKLREGFTPTPVGDAGGQEIGYGHEIQPGEIFTSITEAEGADLLLSDLAKVSTAINDAVAVPLTQNQFDALASFVYNIGAGAFRSSTMLQLLNAGNYAAAAQQFSRWTNSGGNRNAGLVARRQGEKGQFLAP